MTRLQALDPATTTGKARDLLEAVHKKLGITPNMMLTMANSPAVLEGYLNFSAALAGGSLSARLREQIALAVAQANSCEYCLSAHTAIGKMVGLQEDDILASRQSASTDARTDAALRFAHQMVVRRGELDASEVDQVRAAGYSDGEIAEIIANVALNLFTNYFNHVAGTEVDFPRVSVLLRKTA